jgi:hypothetical protein
VKRCLEGYALQALSSKRDRYLQEKTGSLWHAKLRTPHNVDEAGCDRL